MASSSTIRGQRMRPIDRRPRAVCACVALVSCVAGCGLIARDTTETAKEGTPIVRRAERGPVAITLSVAPASLDLQHRAEVDIEVVADRGVTVSVDDYRTALLEGDSRFEMRAEQIYKEEGIPADQGKLRWRYRYRLEFFLADYYALPPARVTFTDSRDAHASESTSDRSADDKASASVTPLEPKTETIETEGATIHVIAGETASLTEQDLRNIRRLDPVDLPRGFRWWWAAVPVIAIALLTVVFLALRRRADRAATISVIPAHEWARRRLAELLAADYVSRRMFPVFFYRISDIVRGYTERRFAVAAPEMTTEEFLEAAARDGRFEPAVRDELRRFLQSCDLVKYARHEPTNQECDAVLAAAESVVERTRVREHQTEERAVRNSNRTAQTAEQAA